MTKTIDITCPTTAERLAVVIDDVGRLTIERPDDVEADSETMTKTDRWIERVHGRSGYLAVMGLSDARARLRKLGVRFPGDQVDDDTDEVPADAEPVDE